MKPKGNHKCSAVQARTSQVSVGMGVLFIVLLTPCFSPADDRSDSAKTSQAFTAINNEVVVDNDTGLLWQKQGTEQKLKFSAAVSYCGSLKAGGRSDWRLPSIFELNDLRKNLVWKGDDHRNPIFYWGSPAEYWSKSSGADLGTIGYAGGLPIKIDESSIEVMSFEKDIAMSVHREGEFYTRCARGRVSPEYIKRWVRSLEDANPEVRWNALVNRIGRIEGNEVREAIPAIRKLASDPNEQVREAAKKILEGIEKKP